MSKLSQMCQLFKHLEMNHFEMQHFELHHFEMQHFELQHFEMQHFEMQHFEMRRPNNFDGSILKVVTAFVTIFSIVWGISLSGEANLVCV